MARTATNYNLTTKTARARLAGRPKGCYTQIAPCICLGYYRDRHTWERRERIAGRYAYRTLGTADDISPADGREVLTLEQAMRAATGANAAAPVGRLHRLPRVDTDRQATDFVDHEQAVAGNASTSSMPATSAVDKRPVVRTPRKNWRRECCSLVPEKQTEG